MNSARLADDLVVTAVRLVRWLKATDSTRGLTGAQASALALSANSGGIRSANLTRLEEVKRPTVAPVMAG